MIFVMTLPWSGAMFVQVFPKGYTETFMECDEKGHVEQLLGTARRRLLVTEAAWSHELIPFDLSTRYQFTLNQDSYFIRSRRPISALSRNTGRRSCHIVYPAPQRIREVPQHGGRTSRYKNKHHNIKGKADLGETRARPD